MADAVRRELRTDASTTDLRIQVEVQDGIVHLYGQVEDLEDVENAEAVAAAVPGVHGLHSYLNLAHAHLPMQPGLECSTLEVSAGIG